MRATLSALRPLDADPPLPLGDDRTSAGIRAAGAAAMSRKVRVMTRSSSLRLVSSRTFRKFHLDELGASVTEKILLTVIALGGLVVAGAAINWAIEKMNDKARDVDNQQMTQFGP